MTQRHYWNWHVFIWGLIILMQLINEYGLGGPDYRAYNISIIVLYAFVRISVFYAFYFRIARLLPKKKYLLFAVVTVFAAYLIPNFYSIIYFTWVRDLVHPDNNTSWLVEKSFYFMSEGLVVAIIGTIAYLAREGLIRQEQEAKMKQEKTNLELQALKSKLNPHFLFNTLNNIYYLVRQNREEAPEAVLQLSDTMRYMLTSSTRQSVSLTTELEAVKDMLNLIKFRVGPDFPIEIVEQIEIDHPVLPTIILNLIENTMKHGDMSDDGFIYVEVRSKVNWIFIKVANRIREKPQIEIDNSTQFGISSLIRLLELTYPDSHQIQLNTVDNQFETTIELKLP